MNNPNVEFIEIAREHHALIQDVPTFKHDCNTCGLQTTHIFEYETTLEVYYCAICGAQYVVRVR